MNRYLFIVPAVLALSCVAGPAMATEPEPAPFVVIGWPMPEYIDATTPSWPQGVAAGLGAPLSVEVATKDLGALDGALEDIRLALPCGTSVQYQVDGNENTQPVRDAIAGGSLYGPHDPAEALWGGGWGEAYKLVLLTAPDCVKPADYTTPGSSESLDCGSSRWVVKNWHTAATFTGDASGYTPTTSEPIADADTYRAATLAECPAQLPHMPGGENWSWLVYGFLSLSAVGIVLRNPYRLFR